MGTLFAVANRQRYRTFIYRLLRQPLVSALSLTLVHCLALCVECILYCFHHRLCDRKTGLCAEQFWRGEHGIWRRDAGGGTGRSGDRAAFPARWGELGMLQPSPSERSIETRFIYGTGTIISILLITLLVGDWIVAGTAARNLLARPSSKLSRAGRAKCSVLSGDRSEPGFANCK